MLLRQQIEREQGGKLFADLPEVPDAASVKVTIKKNTGGDIDDTEVVDVVVANPIAITLPAASSGVLGAVEISVGALDAALYPSKGEVLLAQASTGQTQRLHVRDIDDNAGLIFLRKPLRLALTSADTLSRFRVFYDLTALQVPNIEQNYRAVFAALFNADRIMQEVIFDVGLRPSRNPATIQDLDNAWIDMHLSVPDEWIATELDTALTEGWRATMRGLWAAQRNPNRIRDDQTLVPLVVNRALRYMARFGHVPSAWTDLILDWIELLEAEYLTLLKQTLSAMQWYDDNDDGCANTELETNPPAFFVTLQR